jgi:uncharacterized protein
MRERYKAHYLKKASVKALLFKVIMGKSLGTRGLVFSMVVLLSATMGVSLAQDYKVGDRLDKPAEPPPKTGASQAGASKVSETKSGSAKSSGPTAGSSGATREIKWEELSPKDWDPFAAIRDLNFATLKDSDPKAMEALSKLTDARNKAPVVPELAGQSVKISGFIIPLTKVKDEVHDFLLVPYFGACIHTPPPPSNMVLHVIPDKPFKGGVAMDAVTVSGTLSIERTESPWGTAGYKLSGRQVVKYQMPAAK